MATREENRILNENRFLDFIEKLEDYKIVEENFKYKNANSKVLMKHEKCGHEWNVKISKFMNEGSRCPKSACFQEKRVSHLRKSDEYLNVIKKEKDYEIVDKDFVYKNLKQKIKLRHKKCNHEWDVKIYEFVKRGTRCPKCKYWKRQIKPAEELKLIFNTEKEYILLEDNFKYINSDQRIKVKHINCGREFSPTIHNFKDRGSRCPSCCQNSSKGEQELADYVESLGVEIHRNTRSIITPQELDIYIPEKNFAIEYNGLYWHGEMQKDKHYHINKTKSCQEKGITLFHVFSDEWENKKDIIKSMIKHRLHLTENKVFARKCEFREVSFKEAKQFFEKTHISGFTSAVKKSFGLYSDDKLVACLSLKSPIHKKYKGYIEIGRYATELNHNISGGFSKLLYYAKNWTIGQKEYDKILSYVDLRFGSGGVYGKNQFDLIGSSVLDYWYTNGEERFNRLIFKAQDGKTEKEIIEENMVFRVYGCGNNIYEQPIIN